jgi:hypothetical protein
VKADLEFHSPTEMSLFLFANGFVQHRSARVLSDRRRYIAEVDFAELTVHIYEELKESNHG